MALAGLFISQQSGSHSAGISCIAHKLFYPLVVLHGTSSETSVTPITIGSVLANSKTERFLIPCPHHVSSRLPPSGETCKYAMVPITQRNLKRFSIY
jgi:hypothetical protein